MNGHRRHSYRILVRCDACRTPILWGCSYTRRRRDPKTGEQACVAIDTYQRRNGRRAHRCTIARLPQRRALTLVDHARNVFGDMIVRTGDAVPLPLDIAYADA